jgi:hypothetical protein
MLLPGAEIPVSMRSDPVSELMEPEVLGFSGMTGCARPGSGDRTWTRGSLGEKVRLLRAAPFSLPLPAHQPHWSSPAMQGSARQWCGGIWSKPFHVRRGCCLAERHRRRDRLRSLRSMTCLGTWPTQCSQRLRSQGERPWRLRSYARRPHGLRRVSLSGLVIHRPSGGC